MLREKLILAILLAVPVATLSYFAAAFGIGKAFWIWLVAFVALGLALTWIVRWHARRAAYRCTKCGSVFTISAFVDFTSPHYPGHKHLRCPDCEQRSWCEELERSAAAPPPVNPPTRLSSQRRSD